MQYNSTYCDTMTTTIPAFYNNNNNNNNNSNVNSSGNRNSGNNGGSVQQQSNIVYGPKLPYVQDRSVGVHILERLDTFGQQIAQVDPITGDFTTFNDIKLLSLKVAKGLRKLGIGHGDVVSICSSNNLDVCLPMLGALYVGAIVAPLHPSLCRPDLKHLLSISKPKIIFCDYTSIEIIRKSLAELKLSIDLIIFGDTKKHKSLERFLDEYCEDDDNEIIPFNCTDPFNHIAFIVPTSGTRDQPKGVCISHGNILHHLQSHWDEDWCNVSILNISTLYSITGIKSMLSCFDHGTLFLISPEFSPQSIAKIINDWKEDLVLIIASTFLMKLVNFSKINEYDLSSCKLLIVNGGKLTDIYYKLTESLFVNAKLFIGYGSTETTGMITMPSNDKKFSVGMIDPDVEIKVIDCDTGRILGPHMLGELYVRGKRVMSGYYDDLIATCEVLDKDGWYHTGDCGFYDENFNFYVEGCLADKFTYKNCEIMPFEIEKVLLQHPEIKEACVIGIRNKFDGARAKAFIVRDENSNISETRIKKYLEGQLSPFKQLYGGIVFMEKLPFTPSGKINQRKLLKLP